MLKDAQGNRVFRQVVAKITFPDNIFPPKVLRQHAGPRQGFGPDGIDAMLLNIANELETLYPFWDFQMVELAPEGRTARFSFKFAGYRSTKTTPTTEAPALEPGTAAVTIPNDDTSPVAIPLAQE